MKKLIIISLAILVTPACQSTQDNNQAQSEITQWQRTNFEKLDHDNNGSLDAGEMRGTTQKWMTENGYSEEKQIKLTTKKFHKYDANNDQNVSLEELLAGNKLEQAKRMNKNG